jgi:hypothetical protein
MASFTASVFPASNLSPQSQQWRAAVEKRVSILEDRDTSGDARRIMARWSSAVGSVSDLEESIQDLASLSEAANAKADDAVSWHEAPPVSPGDGVEDPDIPVNPNATWYVCELSKEGGVDKDRVKEVWQWSPPGIDGDDDGKWVQQHWGTDTLGEGAVDYKHLAAAAKGDLEAAKALKGRFDTLAASYEQTKADLEQAKKDVAKAVAGAKDVIISNTEPTGADRKPGNLWVSTAGGTTRLYVFDGDKNAWVLVEGDDAAQAAAAAAEAQKKAKEALDKAQAVEDMATAAKLAAERAQKSADGKNTIFYQADKPSLNGRNDGDLWYDTDDNYRMYRFRAGVDDFIEAGVSAADLTGTMSNSMVEGVWKQAQSSGAVARNPVEGSMIANGAITTTHVQGLDAGVITSGYIGSDRIAARSITAAQMAAGTITAESGVIGSLNANDIKFGTLSGDRIDANTLRGKLIEGGTVRGGTVDGGVIRGSVFTTTTNGHGNRVQIDSSRGVTVWEGNQIKAQLSPTLTNGLAVFNPNRPGIGGLPTSGLVEVSSIIFGAQFQFRRNPTTVNAANDGCVAYQWSFNAPSSGRAIIIASINCVSGAQNPNQRALYILRNRDSGSWMETGYVYNGYGWQSDVPMFMGMATGLPTSGNCTIWTKLGMRNNGANFSGWGSDFASAMLIPC